MVGRIKITDIETIERVLQWASTRADRHSISRFPLRWPPTKESFDIGDDGRVAVPEASGLGITLDPAVVAEFRKA